MNDTNMRLLGKYQHFRNGKTYEVIGSATHSETLEEMVVYLDDKNQTWVRPKKMFFEEVEHEGAMMPRFKYLDCL
jgi:hypothetical protein